MAVETVAPTPVVASNPVMASASFPPLTVPVAPGTQTNAVTDTSAAVAHLKYVRQRVSELEGLAWNDDVASRDAILAELKTNSDKTIRTAALEAAVQFGDRSVVPFMQEIAAQTQDPEEKAKILETIDYINLPSLSEYEAAHPVTPGSVPQTPPSSPSHPHTRTANSGGQPTDDDQPTADNGQ